MEMVECLSRKNCVQSSRRLLLVGGLGHGKNRRFCEASVWSGAGSHALRLQPEQSLPSPPLLQPHQQSKHSCPQLTAAFFSWSSTRRTRPPSASCSAALRTVGMVAPAGGGVESTCCEYIDMHW